MRGERREERGERRGEEILDFRFHLRSDLPTVDVLPPNILIIANLKCSTT